MHSRRIASLTAPSAKTGQRKLLSIPKFSFDRHRCATGLESIYRNRIQDAESKRFHRSRNRLCPRPFANNRFWLRVAPPARQIKPYRAEGNIALPEWGDIPLFDYWRPKLTPYLLQEIEARGGILFNLASDEMRRLFDWKTVETQARIITPQFQVRHNDGWKTIVIYTKMARGALTRYLLKNKIENPEQLQAFEWEGFRFNELRSDNYNYIFTHE